MSAALVLPVRKGGLGNQMFQVAAALVYKRETGRTILMPQEFYNTHNATGEEYATTVFAGLGLPFQGRIDDTVIQLLCQNGFTVHPGKPGFEHWSPRTDIRDHILLDGYFQSYPPIQRHEDFVRSTYLERLIPLLSEAEQCPDNQRIGLHVRRGDYIKFADVHFNQGEEYYCAALSKFDMATKTVWIFSDDIAWCKEQPMFQELPSKVFVEEPHECKALALMTRCHGRFICANSTFSWWGAFLGPYSIRAPCIVPSRWIQGGVGALFPSEWIVL